MTSPSRKRRRTTPPSTSAPSRADSSRAAAAYDAVDRATRPAAEPLWLPAGWLAALLLLTAAAPSLGATPSGDGWRARGSSPSASVVRRSAFKPRRTIKQVAWQDDLAGPALRTAGRMPTDRAYDGTYRVAQQNAGDAFGDTLRESFERPFGVEDVPRPADPGGFDQDADRADQLFDDLPTEPEPTFDDQPEYSDEAQVPTTDSLFDDEPEPIAPGPPADDDIADDLAPPADAPTAAELDARAEERREAMQDCSEALAELKASRLDSIDLSIRITGDEGEDFPYVCRLDDGSVFAPRCWGEITYTWKAAGTCHKPLYFEDVHLERYGHSWGPFVQPLVSGAHFFGRLPILPYMMGLKMPNECVYTLGHYRPGDCAPYLIDPVPFTWRAAILQGGATMGVVGILP